MQKNSQNVLENACYQLWQISYVESGQEFVQFGSSHTTVVTLGVMVSPTM